jgi:N-glycosylase/DNA lyase
MKQPGSYRNAGELAEAFAARKDAIRVRLAEFASVPRSEYFFELVYCLLTPQSSAVNAGKAVFALREAGFPRCTEDPGTILGDKRHYIRFHHTKARWIREAWGGYPAIEAKLTGSGKPADTREWLVRNVKGLGWKEASHFLRNIGCRDLAILDRHILRNLAFHGVLNNKPRTLTPKQYRAIEERFRRFAEHMGITMDELDLLFWSKETGEILK